MSNILARVSNRRSEIFEESTGLSFTAAIPPTQMGKDVVVLLERGLVSQMSFGFICTDDTFEDVSGQLIRTVIQADLFELSIVAAPAYSQTVVKLDARSIPGKFRTR